MEKSYIFSFLLILAFSPVNAQNYMGNKKNIEKILIASKQFSVDVVAGEYEKVMQAYTIDGMLFPNNREILSGSDAILKYWERNDGSRIAYHKITPIEIKVMGKEARDHGYYEGTSVNKEGQEFPFKGKYVIVWKKTKNGWKIYIDIWNRISNG